MRSRDADIVFIPGLGGSGPDHWQSRWQARLPHAVRVEQEDWDQADPARWTARIVDTIARCERPAVAVAHSLGVVALALAAPRLVDGRGVAGAFLVAPPSAAVLATVEGVGAGFVPYPEGRLAFPSLLVASRTDPYGTAADAAALAAAWGSTLLDAGEAGHINTASGHGPWPEGLMAFGGFLGRL